MRGARHLVPALIASVSIVAAAGGGAGSTPSANPAASSAPVTAASAVPPAAAAPSTSSDLLADLDVGGRKMHILCVGPAATVRPTVIFESGLGGDAGQWSDVLHSLGGSVRACAYDRAGGGMSPPAAVGRPTADQ